MVTTALLLAGILITFLLTAEDGKPPAILMITLALLAAKVLLT